MALSDLAVFQEYTQTSMTEMQSQAVQKFNAASQGGLILKSGSHDGDFDQASVWAKIPGLVKRRNAYGAGAQSVVPISQLIKTSVKIAAGTPPVSIDPGMMKWIQKSPEEAGVTIGKQLAEDSIADMLNTGLTAYVAAVGAQASNVHNSAATATLAALNAGVAKMGDRGQDIVSWVVHSKSAFDIYGEALANSNRLFVFGTVRVVEDGFGRPIVVTDSPALNVALDYFLCGLQSGGLMVEQGNEFTDNIETSNGDENIVRTYQAEWVYSMGLRGFTWDQAAGGASPDDSALGLATNWDKLSTSHKDLAGVLVKAL